MRYYQIIESQFVYVQGEHVKNTHDLENGTKVPAEMHEVHYNGMHLGNVASYIPHGVPKTKENIKVGAIPTQTAGTPHKHIINGLKSKEDAAMALKRVQGLV